MSGLPDDVYGELDRLLAGADEALTAGWPGDPATRQPVQTLYLPADHPLVGADVVERVGSSALESVEGEDPASMARITGLDPDVVAAAWPRVLAKLTDQPVEDLRLDLEDGYGNRSDEDEDWDATRVGEVLAEIGGDTAPLVRGTRAKSLEAPTRRRGVRSLDLVLGALGGTLPAGFVVTLPKVTSVDQVDAMVHAAASLESGLGLGDRSLRFEIQVETPQSILGPDGTALVARMIHAADGRCTALHYGTYDYSAFCGIAAAYQSLDHPVADHAKAVMQAAAAGTGVWLSDGSTNVIPVGEETDVLAAWTNHMQLVRRSLERGFYQGWDLHPAQLPTRFAATFAFYRGGFPSAAARLRNFLEQTRSAILDEPATARALADFLLRGLDCGAITSEQTLAATGVSPGRLAELARRSTPEGG